MKLWEFLFIIYCILLCKLTIQTPDVNDFHFHLTSPSDVFIPVLDGFSGRLQCTVYRCKDQKLSVSWLKNDVAMFNNTKFLASSGVDPSSVILQHTIDEESVKGEECKEMFKLPQERTCQCITENYSLVLRNITKQDGGNYRCLINEVPQQLDFHVEVLNSGLKQGFHKHIKYDYTACCLERGINPLCRSMCKPRDMYLEVFDPISCQTADFKNFIHCVTDDGRKNYTSCCQSRSVPDFCHDFCSNNFTMLKRNHRLCLYYLPEIFECFNQQAEET
uniref:Ig-like domain-containing protein n=1 Tax=Parastrongyloides trichosuri TaxID=131310 RepID=A0A0N5A723_PARTI